MNKKEKIDISFILILTILFFQVAVCNSEVTDYQISYKTNSTTSNESSIFSVASNLIQDDGEVYNITLWMRDYENKTSFAGLNITIFDPGKRIFSSYISNGTGHVDLFFLDAGSYSIYVQDGNRTAGHKKINVVQNATHLIETWAYDLNMTLVNGEGAPLANHTVYLYDQMDFQSPNHTMIGNTVIRSNNVTVRMEELGALVGVSETDENGTLSFPFVWNGTYRVEIKGIEEWIEEYVLGELVLTLLEPANGQHVLEHQKPVNVTLKCIRSDVQLQFISASDLPMNDAKIYTRNMQGHLFFESVTNDTGHVEYPDIYVVDDLYEVVARYGNRTIGYQVLNATEKTIHTITCWTSNLTINCVDREGQPLENHIVLVYDLVVFHSPTNLTVITNQTGVLINWSITDENGMVGFSEIWNGTYRVSVMDTGVITEKIIELNRTSSIILPCNKTRLYMKFATSSGLPLPEATVIVSDMDRNVILRELTDSEGNIIHENIQTGEYRVNVLWAGTEVWAGTIDVINDRDREIRCKVHILKIQCLDQFGNILPNAEVKVSTRDNDLAIDLITFKMGETLLLLPQGRYDISVSSGIYSGSRLRFYLSEDQKITISCTANSLVIILAGASIPLFAVTLIMERRKFRKPLKIRKYRKNLLELESIYKQGLVEYKIYRKLKEEYESKVIELGGREIR